MRVLLCCRSILTWSRVGAVRPVISVMLVAGLLAHRRNGFFVFKEGYEYVLVLAVTALATAILGPGRASIDHAVSLEAQGWTGGLIAAVVAVVATAGLLGTFYRPAADPAQPEPAP